MTKDVFDHLTDSLPRHQRTNASGNRRAFFRLLSPMQMSTTPHLDEYNLTAAKDDIQSSFFLRLGHGLLWLEPLWLALLMPSLLFREFFWDLWLLPWLVGALFIFWPIRLLVEHRFAPNVPMNLPVGLLLLWLPVSYFAAGEPVRALEQASLLALGIALYFALINWRPAQNRPWLIVLLLAIGCLLLTIVGPELLLRVPTEFFIFSDGVVNSKPIDLWGTGETINPNVLAGGLLLPLPMLVALAIRTSWARRRWLPPFILLAALPITVVMIFVQSRGSYLALAIALMVVISLRWPWAGFAMIISMLTTVLIVSWEGTSLFLDAFGSDGSITSFSGRLEIWQGTVRALAKSPIWGLGLGNFEVIVPVYLENWNPGILHAHNLFLQVAVDMGLIGLLLYCWLLYRTAKLLINIIRADGYDDNRWSETDHRKRRRNERHLVQAFSTANNEDGAASYHSAQTTQSRRQRHRERVSARRCASLRWTLAVGLLGALVAMLVHGLVDAVMWGTKLSFLPWVLFALAALLWQQPTCDSKET